MPKLLTEEEIPSRLAALQDWAQKDAEIFREFTFQDFAAALQFVNRVATAAEAAHHHPDIDIRWNKVRLALSTHSKGGLTALDFDLADEIDALV